MGRAVRTTKALAPSSEARELSMNEPWTNLLAALVGAIAAASELRCPSPAVPPTCPKQRSTAVTKGQYRSTGEVTDLRHHRRASSATVLPKLAVAGAG
jgi:hypothetical protein